MQHANFWIIVGIVAVLVAVCIARAIYAPIKIRRENKRWARYKQEYATGMR
jgi:membrane protein YdbS with pleckstrin-like domain